MQAFAFVTSLLLAAAMVSAAPSQSEQPVAPSPVASASPAVSPVVSSVSSQPVETPVQPLSSVVMDHPQHSSVVHHHQHQPGYYAPTVVVGQQDAVKPQVVSQLGAAHAAEQYGQPESAALPPNYKPFGSWGLYIGGNPADGYYTNYYKALTNTVDKQAGVDQPVYKPAIEQPASVPLLRQAVPSSSPYVGGDFYSFAYSPSDLNSALPLQAAPQHHQHVAPVGQFYGAPASSLASPADPSSQFVAGLTPYADFYATKKLGQVTQKEVQAPSKGHQRSYYYQYASPVQMAAPVAAIPQKPQVVAYSVPVGSQIVGSQPGVDGAFDPYGIHAFTRYAVKPTVVSHTDSSYYYSYPAGAQPVAPTNTHKHQHQQYYSVPVVGSAYSPFYGFYGYPVNQLHYSTQGVIVPVQGEHVPVHHHQSSPVQPSEPSSDKVEVAVDQLKPQK